MSLFSIRKKQSLALSLIFLAACINAGAQTPIFINEIHYDNTGADTAEGVEIAGPAGTDLTGWDIVLYNGSNGNSYNTVNLSGTIADLCGGFGVINTAIAGIQNGSPDGIALIDDTNTVVQFLSYEGSFMANNGPASGQMSTDIGVTEPSNTAVGDSLQLSGMGTNAEDFTWNMPAPNTAGACNTGQTFIGAGPIDPVINEFVVDHTGSDANEYVEIFGSPNTDYSNFTIVEIEGDGASAGLIDDGIFPVGTTDANGLFVTPLSNNIVENGAVTLLLVEGFTGAVGNDIDTNNDGTIDVTFWTQIVDDVASNDGGTVYSTTALAAGFDGVGFQPGGASRIPDGTDTDTTADWVRNDFDGAGIPALDPGTPDLGEALNTPGASNQVVQPVVSLIINEVQADPDATNGDANGDGVVNTSDDEFIEIFNDSGSDLDMSGWTLSDAAGLRHTFPAGTVVPDQCTIVVFGGGTPTGTFGGAVVQTASVGFLGFNNGGDTITINDGTTDQAMLAYGVEGGNNQSITRDPDVTGTTPLIEHSGATGSGGSLFSPGTQIDGTAFSGCPGAPATVVINEISADPDATNGDANGDGTVNTTQDEFVEIVNTSGGDLDISGWTLADGFSVRHMFPAGTIIPDQCSIVVFGGGTPTGMFGGALTQVASSGTLGLNNGGDTVTLNDGGTDQAVVSYGGEGGNNQSLTRDPDITGAEPLVQHSTATGSGGALFSPGTQIDGSLFAGCVVVPPATVVINEISADPDATNGDANGDSTVDTQDDEFVEIVNTSGGDLDISGWTLADGFSVRHTFPVGTIIPDQCSIVVFGGGTPTGVFGGSLTQIASTGTLGLNNTGDTVTLNDGIADQAVVSYGGEGGNNQSLTRDPDITGALPLVQHTTATGSSGALFSPGTQIDGSLFAGCMVPPPPLVCGNPATLIHDVQGNGAASPLVGNTVEIEAVVVADFQNSNGPGALRGFFLQEEDLEADADADTSEGIFVFDDLFGVEVAVGDIVRVRGDVVEFFDLTELNNVSGVSVCSSGNPLPTATTVNLPFGASDDAEAVEGMLVNLPQTLTISDNGRYPQFGELLLSNGRLFTPTNIVTPANANAQQALNDLNQILIEDGRTGAFQMPFENGQDDATPVNALNPARSGSTITGITGVMDFAFSAYRVRPTTPIVIDETANPRTAAPDPVNGTFKVAGVNLLNFFTTLDQGGAMCGPAGFEQGCRGADSASELTRQGDKLLAAMVAVDADVLGLVEIENNDTASLQAFVDLLNSSAGAGTYDFINTGFVGTDAVKVGFVYKPATATPVGNFEVLDSSVDPLFVDFGNRPTVAQTFADSNGALVTIAVNHLRSKGCNGATGLDQDQNDGQACFNFTRNNAATALVNWLATDPTGSGDSDFLIIGDLNSYAMEDPIVTIENGGFIDLIDTFIGSANTYSFEFGGQVGYLDHALASANLNAQVTGVATWHINADEDADFDYNEEDIGTGVPKPANFFNADPYRASDHDPIVIGLDLTVPEIAFSQATSSTPESTTSFDVEISLTAASEQDVLVMVDSTNGTATSGQDFTAVSEMVTVPAGMTTANVTLTINDDMIDEDDETLTLTLSSPTGATLGTQTTHEVTIQDNDTAGITVTAPATLTTGEDGTTDTFSIVLDSEPTNNVTIPLSSDNTAEGTVQASAVFTPGNWNVPQDIVVTGVDDALVDGDINYNIIIAASTSGDPNYMGIDPADLPAVNINDDGAVTSFTGPTPDGSGVATISFTGGGPLCTFNSVQFIDAATLPIEPPMGYSFPDGLADFEVTGCDVGATLNFTFDSPRTLQDFSTSYLKFLSSTGEFTFVPFTRVGNSIQFTVTDGGDGDDDQAANGTIVDPSGPALLQPAQVPTLQQWALALLALVLLACGVFSLRRQPENR